MRARSMLSIKPVVVFDDIMTCHSMNDAKAKGLAKVVDNDYIIGNSNVIEIRYNV